MKRPPRVVLDTNVVLSALLFGRGTLAPLRHHWHAGSYRPLISSSIAEELMRVLRYPKFKLTAGEQRELLADYLPACETVALPAKLPKLPSCRDPNDVPFLALAVAGRADFLVTGDADLLALNGKIAAPIIPAAAFLAQLTTT